MNIKAQDLKGPAFDVLAPLSDEDNGVVPDLLMATTIFMIRAGQLSEVGDFNEQERHAWLEEEWQEYVIARAGEDEALMIDGLLDIIVIAWGTLIQRYGEQWARVFANEVARSNLDKVGSNMTKRPDGKVQKPDGWVAPRIEEVLAAFRKANVR